MLRLLTLLLPVASACAYTTNGLTWTDGVHRMNEIQVVGSHNSYHVEADPKEQRFMTTFSEEAINFRYSHAKLGVQFEYQQVRSIEIDILADPKGGNYAKPIIRKVSGLPYPTDAAYKQPGAKVMHVPDLDVHTVCASLVECLHDVKAWVDQHPKAVPIPILLEFKTAEPFVNIIGGAKKIEWNNADLLASVDAEIRSVFDAKQLITPEDMRRKPATLEQSVLKFGWPDLDSARGRVFFIMDNDNNVRDEYRKGRDNLEGRVIFTNSNPGSSDCAFQKLNDPTSNDAVANIQKQVAAGYWVRTRADEPLKTVIDKKCDTSMRDAALKSGAQIVSTDFPAYGMSSRWECDYAVRLAGGRTARCNPVNGGKNCSDANLEPPEYHRN